MKYFIGIDDTDNKDSRGTGYRSRKLAALLVKNDLAEVISVSRHQLFFHPDIPYTSQNSSACLMVLSEKFDQLQAFCRQFLLDDCAIGSDAGLCIAGSDQITDTVIKYAQSAKDTILNQDIAKNIASAHNIYLEGLTGDRDGIIGALAACGLRKFGNDGRCIWLKGKELRDFNGVYSIEELYHLTAIDQVTDMQNVHVEKHERIFIDNWLRPVIKNNKIRIIAVEEKSNTHEWRIAAKDYIKGISD